MTATISSNIRISGATGPAPDYNDLSSWEAGEQALYSDLVANDVIVQAVCYDDWPSGLSDSFAIDGWTTDSTRYIEIKAAPGSEHKGNISTGFRLFYNTDWAGMHIKEYYTRISDIIMEKPTGSGLACRNNAKYIVFNRVIGLGTNAKFSTSDLGSSATFNCCLAVNSGFARSGWTSTHINNCVAVGCSVGFNSTDTTSGMVLKNCIAYDCTTSYSSSYINTTDSTNNAASDGATNTPPGANPLTVDIVASDFVDAANDDYHLAAGSSLIGAGANLYSDFTTDIDGDMWPSSGAWDIGFDYYASGGATHTKTLTLGGLIQKQNTLAASLDARIQKTLTHSAPFDALLVETLTLSADIDALLQKTALNQADIDALLQRAQSISTGLDAAIISMATQTATTALDALVRASQALTLSLDALLQRADARTALVDALLQETKGASNAIDALLQGRQTSMADIDALLQGGQIITAALDAVLAGAGVNTIGISLDAALRAAVSVTAQLDAVAQRQGITLASNLDAILGQIGSVSIGLDSIHIARQVMASSLDAMLSATLAQATDLDAVVWDGIAPATIVLSARATRRGYNDRPAAQQRRRPSR